jgi:predicted aminopeptidase
MGFLKLFCLLLLLTSCSKTAYLFKQGYYQTKYIFAGDDNESLLKSKKLSPEDKRKIRNIQKYKTYFNHYFKTSFNDIYNKTVLLETEAISYLVYASKKYEIKAYEHSFPIVGTFPYLGFYEKEDAISFAKTMQEDDYVTYTRKVYAYSSLGYFEDPIFSSFFKYNDYELTSLIFHEMTHLRLFIKDEVDFNENLASFVAKKLTQIYYKDNLKFREIEEKRDAHKEMTKLIVQMTSDLKELYKQSPKNAAKDVFNTFRDETFIPAIRNKCNELMIRPCHYLKVKWNNAVLLEYLTYDDSQHILEKIYNELEKKNLVDFLTLLEKKYKQFNINNNDVKTFEEYLIKEFS